MPIINGVSSKKSPAVNKNNIAQLQMRVKCPYSKNTLHTINTHRNSQPIQNTQPIMSKTRKFGNGMVVNKGQKVSLNNLPKISVCVGWDTKNSMCDIDISAFMLDASRKIISDEWFVFYGQIDSPDRSLHLNCNGTQNDDRCIDVNLQAISNSVSRIVFVLTIDEAESKRLNFSMIDKAYIRIIDKNNEIIRFMLSDYYDTVTAMMLGELYRHNGEWKFSAIGDGVKKDLGGLCEMYGVQTE